MSKNLYIWRLIEQRDLVRERLTLCLFFYENPSFCEVIRTSETVEQLIPYAEKMEEIHNQPKR